MTIQEYLHQATQTLKTAHIATARLDARVLLCDELHCDTAWLLAHTEHTLSKEQQHALNAMLSERQARVPLAYIRGHQEFYGRDFSVTPDVLIPRPESEALIEELKKLPRMLQNQRLIDVGTGSGCLAITAALECPELSVNAVDVSSRALNVARQNAIHLGAKVKFAKSDLLQNCQAPFDVIVANLPYVDASWSRSLETNAEPSLALFAQDHGLALINSLIIQAAGKLSSSGHLLLEADPRQHENIIKFAAHYQFVHQKTNGFCLVFSLHKA